MSIRYDQGAALAAEARALLQQRTGRLTQIDVAYGVQVQVPEPVVKAKAPTLLERLEKEAADLEVSLASVSSQLARKQGQIEELRRYPEDDPFADDTVLRFKKVFPSDLDKKYTYTASKVEGLWYVTGDTAPNGVEWADLVSWLGLGVTDVYKLAPGRAAKVAWSDPR